MVKLSVLAGLLLFLASAPAAGWRQTKSETTGAGLTWRIIPVVYMIDNKGSGDITDGSDFAAVDAAFDDFTKVDCSWLTFEPRGTIDNGQAVYDSQNVVRWVESGGSLPGGAVAITTITYVTSDGEIKDTDIELNGVDFTFTTTDVPGQIITDIKNTMMHEIGHVAGLDHYCFLAPEGKTPLCTSLSALEHGKARLTTMYPTAGMGEIVKRDLHQDDLDGLCAIYSPETRPQPSGCCSSVPGQPGAGFFLLPFLLLAGLLRRRNSTENTCHRP